MKVLIKKRGSFCGVVLSAIAVTVSLAACAQFSDREYWHACRVLENKEHDMSKEDAVKIMRMATKTSHSRNACNNIGVAYMRGDGVERDTLQAVTWMERACKEGDDRAYHNLGMMYLYGWGGVQVDMRKAFGYVSRGVEKKSEECIYDKAYMLYHGYGCTQDYKTAADLFYAAAMKRNDSALYMLWLCYKNGHGVEKDSVMADACLRKAAELGNKQAAEEMKILRFRSQTGCLQTQ